MKDDIIEVVQEITKSCLVLGSVWFTFYFLDKVCFGTIPEENQNHSPDHCLHGISLDRQPEKSLPCELHVQTGCPASPGTRRGELVTEAKCHGSRL